MRVMRGRREMPTILKVLITISALAAVSLGAAYAWQNAQELTATFGSSSEISGEPEMPSESGGQSVSDSGGSQNTTKAVSSSASSDDGDSTSAPEDADNRAGYAREALEGSVPISNPVDYSYFDDAIFFGDSISTGIPLYMKTSVPNAEVIAYQGVSPTRASTMECIEVDGVKMTMLDAAKSKGERKKVYIMLGANSLDTDEETFMEGYQTFVKEVKEQYPGAVIYIQSILPVTATVNDIYESPNINNERISGFNAAILDLAKSLGVYYVDVAQCMVDEGGFLPNEASPVDGMHLNPEYYYKWFDYLRAHTVPDSNEKGFA